MKPVLKYRGGKSKEIDEFVNLIPRDFNRYIEPFLGGGAVFFYLEPKSAILNDVNGKLMTFYAQLKECYATMREQLDTIERIYSENSALYKSQKEGSPLGHIIDQNEDLYYALREKYNHPDDEYLEGVLYYFINKTSYSGMVRYNKNGEFNVPYGRYAHFNTHIITDEHSKLLQNAELFNDDYSRVFEMADNNDFIFLDPPYDCIFSDYGNEQYEDGFGEDEHRRLAEDFYNLNCRALMVIGETRLTNDLYHNYITGRYHKNYSVNIRNRFNAEANHLIVRNY